MRVLSALPRPAVAPAPTPEPNRVARMVVAGGAVLALATTLVVLGGLLVGHPAGHRAANSGAGGGSSAAPGAGSNPGAPAGPPGTSLQADIAAAQSRLRAQPGDFATWGRLGTAYVEQARITGDPSYYPRAQAALARAVTAGGGHDLGTLVGLGALANARHRFAEARTWAGKALAVNPANPAAHGVLVDALTQLGDDPKASAAAQQMLDLRPDISSYTRASYELEQHGDVAGATDALQRALETAASAADIAFCRQYLGELALGTGRPAEALRQFNLGLTVAPGSGALVAGKARAEAARGDAVAALRDYAAATARLPLPQYLLEYGELAQASGQAAEAKRQYALVLSQQQLFAAGGVVDDLSLAQYQADHGDATSALRHARAEWGRRHNVQVADALAWALFRHHQPAAALPYSRLATGLGWRNALFLYHRGMIEQALGQRAGARADLAAALALNPAFSPVQAPVAKAALAKLGGAR